MELNNTKKRSMLFTSNSGRTQFIVKLTNQEFCNAYEVLPPPVETAGNSKHIWVKSKTTGNIYTMEFADGMPFQEE
jgi:hypothetical protein